MRVDTVTSKASLRIATMTRADLDFAIGLAADEGWNPGLNDAAAFHTADRDGFLIARVGDRPVGCISAVSYEGRFGFIGLYIVEPACRGKGYGIALLRLGMKRLAGHNIGLDGGQAQQDNYRRSGFRPPYRHLRFRNLMPPRAPPPPSISAAPRTPL